MNNTVPASSNMSQWTGPQLAATFTMWHQLSLTAGHSSTQKEAYTMWPWWCAALAELGLPTGVTTPSNPVGFPAAAREAG